MTNHRINPDLSSALASLRGADLLADLRAHAPIGREGIVAGQAVASAAMRRLGIKADAPINDVDVFLRHHAGSERATAIAKIHSSSKRRRLVDLAQHVTSAGGYFSHGHYKNMFHTTIKEGYALLATTREDMLNEVVFERLPSQLRESDARVVINGFDMNCVQIAVDAETESLIWTPGFEEFLSSWQLRIANVNTPFHTAARYFKKKRALGCYGDDELNMATCALPDARGVFDEGKRYGLGHSDASSVTGRYGAKAHQDYLDEAADLSLWFEEAKVFSKANIWTMKPVFKGRENLFESIKREVHPEHAQGLWAGDTTKLLLTHASAWCESRLRPASKPTAARIESIERRLSEAKMPENPKRLIVDMARFKGKDWIGKEDLSEHDAIHLSKVVTNHENLLGALCIFPPKRQAQICAELRRREAIHGDIFYGWIESLNDHGHRRPNPNAPLLHELLGDASLLDAFCELQKLGGERQLASPLPLKEMAGLATRAAKSLLGVEFKELLNANALKAEGSEMRHCVGGYADKVERGSSRIIQIIGPAGDKSERATLEASIDSYGEDDSALPQKLSIAQNRSFANADPGPKAQASAQMLAASFGAQTRTDKLLAIAPALCRALDAGAIHPLKNKRAGVLLKLALNEAQSGGERYSKIKDIIESSLNHHFPPATTAPAADEIRAPSQEPVKKTKKFGWF